MTSEEALTRQIKIHRKITVLHQYNVLAEQTAFNADFCRLGRNEFEQETFRSRLA